VSFQNVTNITDPASNLAEVNGVALMFWDIFEAKYGSGKGAVFLLLIPLGCGVFCGLHSITSASRYLFESCMFGNSEEKKRKRKEKKRKDFAFRRPFNEKAKYYTGLPRAIVNACLTTMVMTPMRPMIVAHLATCQTAHIRVRFSLDI